MQPKKTKPSQTKFPKKSCLQKKPYPRNDNNQNQTTTSVNNNESNSNLNNSQATNNQQNQNMRNDSNITNQPQKKMKSLEKINENPLSSAQFLKIKANLEKVTKNRKEIKEDYIRSNTRKYIITKWKEVIQILQPIDIRLLLIAVKVLGDIYVELDEYETGRNLYCFYKVVSFRLELLEETMYAYEALGNVYKFLCQYNKAIKCYKKMIEMSWILNKRTIELRGYDHIGIQYFYLGNKDKARYYHDRMIYGIYEKDSKIKENVITNFKNKHYQFFNEDLVLIKNNPTNEELTNKFIRYIALFENGKHIDIENYEILRNQDMMKNSFISDVDMTFQVIHEKYLEDDDDDNVYSYNNKKDGKNYGYKKGFKKSSGTKKKDDDKESLSQVNNLILSHLSNKRKDYNNEKFERIFLRFDTEFAVFQNKYGISMK